MLFHKLRFKVKFPENIVNAKSMFSMKLKGAQGIEKTADAPQSAAQSATVVITDQSEVKSTNATTEQDILDQDTKLGSVSRNQKRQGPLLCQPVRLLHRNYKAP